MKRSAFLQSALLAWSTVFVAGCLSAPEHCHGCLALLIDGGVVDATASDSGGGSGGTGGTAGGIVASGGMIGSGGTNTGGAIGSGGMIASGGMTGSGGAATGGGIGTGTGGGGTSGSATGGMGTGGAATGGTGTGGTGTGGVATGGAGGAGTGGTGTGGAGNDPDLVLWYKFDESSGTTAVDSAMFGGTARNGTVSTAGGGTASFSTTHQVGTHAVNLVGTSSTVGGYVTIPSLQTLAPTALTISAWVNLTTSGSAQDWERVFDFGNSSTIYMFLTARAGDSPYAVRFAITTTGNAATAEQRISGTTALSSGGWHHLVVVLAAGTTYTGRLYVDNVQVGSNPAMTLHPTDLGATTSNRLGRSQFTVDPYFNGYIDDFRVYKRALTATEITTLYGQR